MGFSKDLSQIYFVSEERSAAARKRAKRNLYLYEGGGAPSSSFIATLAAADTINGAGAAVFVPTPLNERPDKHAARVSPDGVHARLHVDQHRAGAGGGGL